MTGIITDALIIYSLCIISVAITIYDFLSGESPKLISVVSGGFLVWFCGKYIVTM